MSAFRAMSDAEASRFLKAALRRPARERERDHLLLWLLLATGVRPSEALRMTAADFNVRTREPWVRVRRLKKRAARGVIDDLPIATRLARALRAYFAKIELAPGERPWPFTIRYLQRVFHQAATAAALPKRFSLYSLRHTAGTRLYRATRDLRLVQEQLGHARMSTTEAYAHVDPERRRAAAELVGGDL